MSPLRATNLNISSIPDSIRTGALINTTASVGPRQKFRSIMTSRRRTEPSLVSLVKPKRVENIETILNRVIRANCCLKPAHPEPYDVMQRAVGDTSELTRKPFRKSLRIRRKFLNNQFLQNINEDFMKMVVEPL